MHERKHKQISHNLNNQIIYRSISFIYEANFF